MKASVLLTAGARAAGAVAVTFAVAAAVAAPAKAENVAIGTSNPGSIYHSSGAAIAKVVSKQGGSLRATIQPFASPNVYIPAVNAGEIEFGLANVYELSLAVEGKAHFDGRPNPNVRAVGIMYPLRVGVFVRKDSDIKTIADLKGRTMPDGYVSQKILLPIIDAEYATAGLTRADMTPVQVPNVVGGANEFISGKVDGFLFALGAAKVREAEAAVGIRALPLPDSPETLAAVNKFLPLAYLRPEKPGPKNPGVTEAMHVIAYDALVFASADASDEAVYQMAKAMFDNKADLAAAFGPFALFQPGDMAKSIAPIEYHPGAIKFYEEQGEWPPQ